MGRLAMSGCLVVVAALSGASCAQLVGIDDTNSNGRLDSVTVTRLSLGNKVVQAPLDLTGLQGNWLIANAASAMGFDRVTAVNAGNGKWASNLHDAAPFEFTLPDVPAPLPRVFSFQALALKFYYTVLEHPDPAPAPANAMLSVTVDLEAPYVATDAFQVNTLGSWTRRGFAPAEIPQAPDVGAMQIGPVAYAFATSGSASGRPQLDKLTSEDAFLILRYKDAVLNGVAEAAPFDQTGNDTVKATMKAVPPDLTLNVNLTKANLGSRFSAVRPAVSGLSMSWSLVAAPGHFLAQNSGPVLNSGSLAATEAGLIVGFGNPFVDRGWKSIFTIATSESRVYTPTGTMTPVTLFAGINQFIEPSAAGVSLEFEAGLPQLITLNGKSLSTDGLTIPLPTTLARLTFVPDPPGNTLYNIQLYELVLNGAMTGLDYRLVFIGASDQPSFDIPPEMFVKDHRYTVRALTTSGGYASVATGDFLDRQLPLSQAYVDSGVFTVTVTP